jgi:hypothetical protein
MRQVLLRASSLAMRPWVFLALSALILGGCAFSALPLFGVPGYEISAAMALLLSLCGGGIGASAAAQERKILRGQGGPTGAHRDDSALVSTARAALAATLLCAFASAPPFLTSFVHAWFFTPCNPLDAWFFYPLLTLPSAALASSVGAFAGFACTRKWPAAAVYGLIYLAFAAATVWPIAFGPQVFGFNHFAGYLPGPLYDEALYVPKGLLWFRLTTLMWAAAAWALSAMFLDMTQGELRVSPKLGPAALLALFGAAALSLEWRGPELEFRSSHRYVIEQLGGLKETAHLRIYFAKGKPREEVERMAEDFEFRRAQLEAFFGGGPKEKMNVYVYPTPDDKRRWVGAGPTQFAKPWLFEVHLNDAPFPHPSVKHELAHAMAAHFTPGLFGVPTRLGLFPVMGIIEGLAVAADNPLGELSLHEWAAGMRKQKLAPDVRKILSPDGFYKSSASRAYTLVGSFLRYLGETYGPAKLMALYGGADFQKAYGRPLSELATEWEKHLDALPLDEAAVNQAFLRFREGSLFARPCAREVAKARREAGAALRKQPLQALKLYEKCARIQPEEPAFALGKAQALAQMDQGPDADAILAALEHRIKERPALLAQVLLARADVAYQMANPQKAEGYLLRVRDLRAGLGPERTAEVKLAALRSSRGEFLYSYFFPGEEELKLLKLREVWESEDSAVAAYLLGRRTAVGAPQLSATYLHAALRGPLPDSIRREALRLSFPALYLAGDCPGLGGMSGHLPDYGASLQMELADWLARCKFAQALREAPH